MGLVGRPPQEPGAALCRALLLCCCAPYYKLVRVCGVAAFSEVAGAYWWWEWVLAVGKMPACHCQQGEDWEHEDVAADDDLDMGEGEDDAAADVAPVTRWVRPGTSVLGRNLLRVGCICRKQGEQHRGLTGAPPPAPTSLSRLTISLVPLPENPQTVLQAPRWQLLSYSLIHCLPCPKPCACAARAAPATLFGLAGSCVARPTKSCTKYPCRRRAGSSSSDDEEEEIKPAKVSRKIKRMMRQSGLEESGDEGEEGGRGTG